MKRTNLLNLLLLSPLFTLAQTAPKPYGVLPSERQLRWHEMEMYTLIHYTPTTFQNKEWGFGDADPKIFHPSQFNADQIAAAAASGGFKGLISVAKHHDGFCLWPTKTTSYSVASSTWKDGKGDMVKEFMEASHNHGLKFGVYLSAWDRNDTRYGTPAYVEAYRAQLTELMSNYGEIFTSWHDGANGGDGYYGGKNEKRKIDNTVYYEWEEKTWPIVRKLQPMAMIFSDIGPDMRWVGNEKGFAAETSWSTLTPIGINGGKPVPGGVESENLSTGTRDGKYWIPAECDVPQRPGWFYHADQNDKVKTPDQLFEIYMKSVGRGGNMNLGLAPMPEGYLHENDVKSLEGFGKKIKETFAVNMAKGATAKASNVRENHAQFSEKNLFDEDRYSYYASDDQVLKPSIEITLAGEKEFDLIRLRENIKLGQRLDSVEVEIWENNNWKFLTKATSIGATRLIKLNNLVKAKKIRLKLYAPVAPTLSDFALFKEAKSEIMVVKSERKKLDKSAIVMPDKAGNYEKAFDGNLATNWNSKFIKNPSFNVVLKKPETIVGLEFTPNQNKDLKGVPTKYKVEISENGKTWKSVASGEFSNIKANPIAQSIEFKTPVVAKFIRFIPVELFHKSNDFTVAEFNIFIK